MKKLINIRAFSDAYAPVGHIVRHLRSDDALEAYANYDHNDPAILTRNVVEAWGDLTWIAVHNNLPVAIVGALEMWPGVWSAYLLATPDFPKVAFAVNKFILNMLMPLIRERKAHRCEARSMATHAWAHTWLKRLGARKEATLKAYGKNGEDFFIYRWDE